MPNRALLDMVNRNCQANLSHSISSHLSRHVRSVRSSFITSAQSHRAIHWQQPQPPLRWSISCLGEKRLITHRDIRQSCSRFPQMRKLDFSPPRIGKCVWTTKGEEGKMRRSFLGFSLLDFFQGVVTLITVALAFYNLQRFSSKSGICFHLRPSKSWALKTFQRSGDSWSIVE